MKKKALYIDMDGTLARFHDADKMFIEAMWTPGFYVNLKPFENLVDAIKLFKERNPDTDVYVLSAVLDTDPPFIVGEKNEWFDKYLPEISRDHRIYTRAGEDKSDYIDMAVKECFLLDDFNKNLYEFENAGGNGIKFHNDINHRGLGEFGGSKGNLWEGSIVHYYDTPERICGDLEDIVFGLEKEKERVVNHNDKDDREPDLSEFVIEDNRLIHYIGKSDTVVIPEGIEVIGFNAFWDGKNLKHVQFPSTLKEIESGAFADCDLQGLKLPIGLKCIGDKAFGGCNSLKGAIFIPHSVEYLDPNAFEGCENIRKFIVSTFNNKFSSNNGIIYANAAGGLVVSKCPSGVVGDVHIPYGPTMIDSCAFKDCQVISDIELPASLHWIYPQAFMGCNSLEEIVVPVGVTEIQLEAFADCKNLRRVVLPDTLSYIGDRIFDGCKNLEDVVVSDEAFLRYCDEFDLLDQVYMTPCYEKLNARYMELVKAKSVESLIQDASGRAENNKFGKDLEMDFDK